MSAMLLSSCVFSAPGGKKLGKKADCLPAESTVLFLHTLFQNRFKVACANRSDTSFLAFHAVIIYNVYSRISWQGISDLVLFTKKFNGEARA